MALRKSNVEFAALISFGLLAIGVVLPSPSFGAAATASPLSLEWHLVTERNHDETRFTQGFAIDGEYRLESSGGFGNAYLVIEHREDDRVLARFDLPGREFAEGATFAGEAIWLVTWRDGIARQFNRALQVMRTVRYEGEGWGLTYDGKQLIMSDGSDRLHFRDRRDFTHSRQVRVRDGDRPVHYINEMTYAHGYVWANIFQSDWVAVIDPDDGRVAAWLDFSSLRQRFTKPRGWSQANNVLNGIAWDATSGHFWLTGKRWPLMFEIAIDHSPLARPTTADIPETGGN
jgi:glutamine cyclotransferase